MAGNIPNTSRTLYDATKAYGPMVLQQGVPVHDADVNEANDNIWIRGIHMMNHISLGLSRFPRVDSDGVPLTDSGFLIQEGTPTTNNFQITAGYACCYGVLVPNTYAMPPVDIDYEDQVMFTGTVYSVGAGAITDDDKYFETGHDLVGCIVHMLTGAEAGSDFVVTSRDSFTTLSLSGGTGSIAPTDTYEIYPPALTIPSGTDRDDSVYLMVWFDDINSNEDTAITDPGTGIEAVHASKIRMCVRVNEGSSSIPATGNAVLGTYGIRHMKLATLERLNGNAAITTAMIVEELNTKNSLRDLSAENVIFDTTVYSAQGYTLLELADRTVQGTVDQILGDLADSAGSTGGSVHIGQAAVTAYTPDTISAGTVHSAIQNLSSYVNDRVRLPHPDTTITAPVLVWRDHGITSDAAVTADTTSWYLIPQGTLGTSDGVAYVTGGYLSAGNIVTAPIGSPTKMSMTIFYGGGFINMTKNSPSGSFAYATAANWDAYFSSHSDGVSILGSGMAPSVWDLQGEDLNFTGNLEMWDGTIILKTTSEISHEVTSTTSPSRFLGGTGSLEPSIWMLDGSLWITSNCDWSGSAWTPVDNSTDATALVIATAGIIHYQKSSRPTTLPSSWGLAVWDSTMILGLNAADKGASEPYSYNCFASAGNVYEEVRYRLGGAFQMATTNETVWYWQSQGYNFRNRWDTAPSAIAIASTGSAYMATTGAIEIIASVDNWGFGMRLKTDTSGMFTNVGVEWYNAGSVVCYS